MPRARKLVFLETFLAIQKRLSGVGVLNLSFQVSIDQTQATRDNGSKHNGTTDGRWD